MTELKPGQIWSTKLKVRTFDGQIYEKKRVKFYILIAYAWKRERVLENTIRVWPVRKLPHQSIEVSREDVIAKTGFGEFLVEIWNERPMLAGNLGKLVGEISAEQFKEIVKIRKRVIGRKRFGSNKPRFDLWRAGEIKFFEFLSGPVLDMLWRDSD